MKQPEQVKPPDGKLAVFLPGLGAVSTTFIAGCLLARKGTAPPIGSLTQMGTIRLGKRTDHRAPKLSDFVPLAKLDQLEFCAWDLFPDNAYEAALHAEVLEARTVEAAPELVEPISNNRLRCHACGHLCPIPDGAVGVCKVRFNRGGRLMVPWGYVGALQCDPIEKKPFEV